MRKPVLALAWLALGCNQTEALDKRVGELEQRLATEREERDDLAKQLAALTKEVATVRETADKVDEIQRSQKRTMDVLVSRSTVASAPARRPEPDRAKTYSVPIDGSPVEGPADAKVTLVWAYEYQCPYCERSRTVLADIKKRYGKDLRIVYRQFVVHPTTAMASALAACAAGKQRKFPRLDQLLWEEGYLGRKVDDDDVVKCWTTPAGCPVVLGFARTAGLELTRFKADMKACDTVVSDGMRELTALGVVGTPSFFVNGRFLTGTPSVYSLSTVIDEELKKARDRIQLGSPAAGYYKQWVVDRGQKTLDP